jgi:hypothetical protein
VNIVGYHESTPQNIMIQHHRTSWFNTTEHHGSTRQNIMVRHDRTSWFNITEQHGSTSQNSMVQHHRTSWFNTTEQSSVRLFLSCFTLNIKRKAPLYFSMAESSSAVVFVDPKKIRELLAMSDVSTSFSSLFADHCTTGINNRYTIVHAAISLSTYASEFQMIPELEKGIRLIIEDIQSIATDIDSMTTSPGAKHRLSDSAIGKLGVIIDGMNVIFRWFSLIASSIEAHCVGEARRLYSVLQNGLTTSTDRANDTQINQLVFDLASILAELSDKTDPLNKHTFTHQYLDDLLDIEVSLASEGFAGSTATDRRVTRLALHINTYCARAAASIKTQFDVLSQSVF